MNHRDFSKINKNKTVVDAYIDIGHITFTPCSDVIRFKSNDPSKSVIELYKKEREYFMNYVKYRTTNPIKVPHEIKDVIFNPPATIVFWKDGTKTVVKAQNGEAFDPEKGLAMAFFKKMHGNTGRFNNIIHTWVRDYKPEEKEPHNTLSFGYPNEYSMEIDFPKDLYSKELDCIKNDIVREVKLCLEAIHATRKMRKISDAE